MVLENKGKNKVVRNRLSSVGTFSSGVDTVVNRIDRAYEIRGMVDKVTSYIDTTTSTKKNHVAVVYNDFAQLTSDEQAHAGATGSAPKVQYGYADGSANTIRRTTVTYPNTNALTYSYSGTDANKLSRVEKLTFNSGGAVDVVDYTYFGLGSVAKTNYPQPATSNTMASGSSFSGFDRFGRVIDVLWTNSTFGDLAQLKYGYDRVSNRTYRQDVRAASFGESFDELYGYDNLQRLRAFDRGALDGTPLDHISTPTKRQTWNLDPTGNWNGFTSIAEGTPLDGLVQNRTANAANEVTAIGATVGDIWEAPVHDRNGNMTTMPKPATPTAGYDGKYDAWNRLVELTETTGGLKVAEYEYDGLNRRTIRKKYDPPGTLDETRDYYYSDTWQVLEEQVSSVAKEQFVWGLRYIDDLILRDRDTGTGLSDERLYALHDANWNVIALTNTSGAVQMRLAYEAYGTSTALNDNFTFYGGGPDYEWEYRFTGRRLDLETGLYYFRFRYYHAGLGRFVGPDPIGYRGSRRNLYTYVGNIPTLFVDPLGLERVQVWAKIHGGQLWGRDTLRVVLFGLTSVEILKRGKSRWELSVSLKGQTRTRKEGKQTLTEFVPGSIDHDVSVDDNSVEGNKTTSVLGYWKKGKRDSIHTDNLARDRGDRCVECYIMSWRVDVKDLGDEDYELANLITGLGSDLAVAVPEALEPIFAAASASLKLIKYNDLKSSLSKSKLKGKAVICADGKIAFGIYNYPARGKEESSHFAGPHANIERVVTTGLWMETNIKGWGKNTLPDNLRVVEIRGEDKGS